MTEQTHWMIDVEYKIEIVGCIDDATNAENVAINLKVSNLRPSMMY
jgi:hypothetical protein